MFRPTLSHGTPDVNGKKRGLPGNGWGRLDPAGGWGGCRQTPPRVGRGVGSVLKKSEGGVRARPPFGNQLEILIVHPGYSFPETSG